jgi:hypothetical protein
MIKMNQENIFREIEKNIDQFIESHPFLKEDKNFAALSLLYQNDMYGRFPNIAGLKDDFPNIDMPFDLSVHLRRGVERALYLVFEKCPITISTRENDLYGFLSEHQHKLLVGYPDFLELALNYEIFENFCKRYSRGYMDISVSRSSIKFMVKDVDEVRPVVFEYIRRKDDENKFEIGATIELHKVFVDSHKLKYICRDLNFWLHKTGFLPTGFNFSREEIAVTVAHAKYQIKSCEIIPLDWNLGNYTLKDFRNLWEYLLIKSISILFVLDPFHSNQFAYPLFFIQKKVHWIEELTQATGLDLDKVNSIVNDLTFDHRVINVTARIRPFIPVFDDFFALSPLLITRTLFERDFLDLQCKINKKKYDELSNQKELLLIDEIQKIIQRKKSVLLYKPKIIIKDKNGKPLTDIDLTIIEKHTKTLALAQLKWPLQSKSVLERYEKDTEIENGISQAKIASDYIKNNLSTFLANHFKGVNTYDIENVLSLVISKDNIGTSVKHSNDYPVIDYDVFKQEIIEDLHSFKEIFRIAVERPYLPKPDIDYTMDYKKLKILNYDIYIPGFHPLN